MKYVVTPISVPELRQTMTDGMEALRGEEMRTNLVKNVLVVQEVYEAVPQDILIAHENDPQASAAASFGFGLHTGMELQRRIAKFEPERLLARDERAVIERLVARHGENNIYLPGFGRVSIDIAVAAVAEAAIGPRGPKGVVSHDPVETDGDQ